MRKRETWVEASELRERRLLVTVMCVLGFIAVLAGVALIVVVNR